MATAYFAYGTNMSRAQMAYRCPGAGLVQPAVLRDHRFVIASHGFGTVSPERTAAVHGVLWLVTAEDERALDRYEGVEEGMYQRDRRRVHVRLGDASDAVEALLYVAPPAPRGQPRVGYLQQVIAGALAQGLPDDYVTELRARQSLETKNR
jgi:gamma-glutamylcyclotransferase (GGCT)/AIG2-like uncharacterized protein YtfP